MCLPTIRHPPITPTWESASRHAHTLLGARKQIRKIINARLSRADKRRSSPEGDPGVLHHSGALASLMIPSFLSRSADPRHLAPTPSPRRHVAAAGKAV